MSTFTPLVIDRDFEDDLRAEARACMFAALRKAFAKRAEEGLLAKDLAEALGKDRGYVSRVLNGVMPTEFETLFVFLEALGHHVTLNPVPHEELEGRRANFDARPASYTLETDGRGLRVAIKVKGAPIPTTASKGSVEARMFVNNAR